MGPLTSRELSPHMSAAQFSAFVALGLVFLILLPHANGQSAICSQIWQCPVASVSVTYHWTTAPGDVAMINVFNTTGAQEGACGVIFFVDSTDRLSGATAKAAASGRGCPLQSCNPSSPPFSRPTTIPTSLGIPSTSSPL